MNIRIDSLLIGAECAVGTVVIIDVFRAFTTAAVTLAKGATKIIIVRDVEEALALRAAGLGHLCMGEVGGRAPPAGAARTGSAALADRTMRSGTRRRRRGGPRQP